MNSDVVGTESEATSEATLYIDNGYRSQCPTVKWAANGEESIGRRWNNMVFCSGFTHSAGATTILHATKAESGS